MNSWSESPKMTYKGKLLLDVYISYFLDVYLYYGVHYRLRFKDRCM